MHLTSLIPKLVYLIDGRDKFGVVQGYILSPIMFIDYIEYDVSLIRSGKRNYIKNLMFFFVSDNTAKIK